MNTKLLVIDEDPGVNELLRLVLEQPILFTTCDPVEALHIANSESPDLILMELHLPRIDGISISRLLKSTPETRDFPILVATSVRDDERRAEMLLTGVEDLIDKPLQPRELKIRIQTLLKSSRMRAGPHSDPDVIRCGNLILDRGRHEAKIDEKPLVLTSVEARLLELLIRSQGAILDRKTILNSIWSGKEVSARVVDNHILSLRKKLQGFNHRLVSVYGAGYGLKPPS